MSFARRFTQLFLTHSRSRQSHYPGSSDLRRRISPRLEEGCPTPNLVKMQAPQRSKLLGKAHGICVIMQKYPVYFSPMVDGNSIYLVKLSDGHKAKDKQHEIQNVAADMAAG